jgi:hypothetical protein
LLDSYLRRKRKKQLLIQFEKDNEKHDEYFALLKVELEEAKKIEDNTKQQLSEKKERCKDLEEEVVKNRKGMEKFKALYLQNIPSIKALVELNDILRKQRSRLLKTVLGYLSGSRSKQPESKEIVKMIKFQVNRQSDHVSTLPPKNNKDKMIPDKKKDIERWSNKFQEECHPSGTKIFSMVIVFTALILVIRLEIVKLSLETCNCGDQEISNVCNIELNNQ